MAYSLHLMLKNSKKAFDCFEKRVCSSLYLSHIEGKDAARCVHYHGSWKERLTCQLNGIFY